MRTPPFLAGVLHCIECSQSWGTVWNTQAPHPICHLCGGRCVPEGLQRTKVYGETAIDAECFRLTVWAIRRTMS